MGKVPKIIGWYVVIIVVASAFIYISVPFIPLSIFSSKNSSYHLLNFEKHLVNFERAPRPRIVILGPSYAFMVGELSVDSSVVHNLGCSGLRFPEVIYLANRYCEHGDTIFLFCSPRDIVSLKMHQRPRSFITSRFRRRMAILQYLLNFRESETAFNLKALGKQIEVTKALKTDDIFLKPYYELQGSFANLHFVLNPYKLPKESVSDEYRRRMKLAFNALDLSDFTSSAMLKDVCHFNPIGLKIVRLKLTETIQGK